MAATGTPTPNIGLRIPIGTDPASVDDINYNSNLIDTKLGAVGSDSVQDQIDTLNSKIAPVFGEIVTNLTYEKSGNVVTIFLNGVSCSAASSWTTLAAVPSTFSSPRYSAHTKTLDGNDLRVSSGVISYRGSSTSMFGCITYVYG